MPFYFAKYELLTLTAVAACDITSITSSASLSCVRAFARERYVAGVEPFASVC